MLTTLWLPITDFQEIQENIKELKDITLIPNHSRDNRDWDVVVFSYNGNNVTFTMTIDSLGYIYIEDNKDNKDVILEYFYQNILNQKTKDLIGKTFLNETIACKKIKEEKFKLFFQELCVDFHNSKKVRLEYLHYDMMYGINKENPIEITHIKNSKVKFVLEKEEDKESVNLDSIINRNFQNLLSKSIVFSHGLGYEKYEVYDLKLLKAIIEIPDDFILNIYENGELLEKDDEKVKNILENILKKAIQDTVEEKTLLRFLEQTKGKYLRPILEKISYVNGELLNFTAQILARDEDEGNIKLKNIECEKMDSVEELEVFVQKLFHIMPQFKIVESKVKEAYYIKVGNTTTDGQVGSGETIDNMLFYERWKTAINYFKSTADKMKDILTIYHQNRNIKELEDISYYENYKADLDDIKNIESRENKFVNETKTYITRIVAAVAVITLAGEVPLYKRITEDNVTLVTDNESLITHDWFSWDITTGIITTFGELCINIIIYLIIFFLLSRIPKVKRFFSNHISIEEKANELKFDASDYDKHEHRSNKSIKTFDDNKRKKLTVIYSEVMSAYSLMRDLQKKEISSYLGNEFSLFPSLLQGKYKDAKAKGFRYIEDYRVSRRDKMTIKILLRYKITDISLKCFLKDFVKEDKDFLDELEEIYENEGLSQQTNSPINPKKIIDKLMAKEDDYSELEMKLNFYVVYAFILKKDDKKRTMYEYNVFKDQFRVHYHINKLPIEGLEEIQDDLAQIIYIYFLARFKDFSYLKIEEPRKE